MVLICSRYELSRTLSFWSRGYKSGQSARRRALFISSIAARFGSTLGRHEFYIQRIQFTEGIPANEAYASHFSGELGERLKGTGSQVTVLNQVVKTCLSQGITDDPAMRKRLENGVSVEEGAQTQIHLASCTDSSVAGVTGEHWQDCAVISRGLSKFKYIMAAHDLRKSVGPKLWQASEKMIAAVLQEEKID